MADVAVTATKVGLVIPQVAETFDMIAGEAINAGQAVYFDATTRKALIADANVAGKQQFRGIALKSVGAGQAVSILKKGFVEGFTLSGLNGDAQVFLSDTAGALADAASATKTVIAGRVMALADSNLTKVLYIDADWIANW